MKSNEMVFVKNISLDKPALRFQSNKTFWGLTEQMYEHEVLTFLSAVF